MNYIDTVSAYTYITLDISNLYLLGWHPHTKKTSSTSSICPDASVTISLNNGATSVFLSYYENLYGRNVLFITFNLRKVYTGTNNNSEPLTQFDHGLFENIVRQATTPFIPSTIAFPSILDFQVSRADFAVNKLVPEYHFNQYTKALSLLNYRNYAVNNYKGTQYLMSSKKKYAGSAIVIRIYDKTTEMLSKGFTPQSAFKIEQIMNLIDYFDSTLENAIESALKVEDDSYLLFVKSNMMHKKLRLELQFRRSKLRRELTKLGYDTTFRNVLDEQFQHTQINNYIQNLKLDAPILSIKSFKSHLDSTFRSQTLKRDLTSVATIIRNGRYPLSTQQKVSGVNRTPTWLSRNISRLYDKGNGCHIITTSSIDLEPFDLL